MASHPFIHDQYHMQLLNLFTLFRILYYLVDKLLMHVCLLYKKYKVTLYLFF
jgi:hypothetical protein